MHLGSVVPRQQRNDARFTTQPEARMLDMHRSVSHDSSAIYRRRWWTVWVLSLNIMIITINNASLNVGLPTLQRELAATASDLQWIVNAYGLALVALLFASGSLGDRMGRALIMRLGIAIFALGTIWAATADSAAPLIAARAIIGIGGALMTTSSFAIMIDILPLEERGKGFGIFGGLSGIGFALGPIIGGLLIAHFSWIWVFLFNLPLLAAVALAGVILIPESHNPNATSIDVPGTILGGGALTVLVYGLVQGGHSGWTDGTVIEYLIGSVCLAGLFALWETHTGKPEKDIQKLLLHRCFRQPHHLCHHPHWIDISVDTVYASGAGLFSPENRGKISASSSWICFRVLRQ